MIGYTYGSTVQVVRRPTTLQVPGVKRSSRSVFASGYPQALLVLADNYYAATLGAQELRVVWNSYPANQLNSCEIKGRSGPRRPGWDPHAAQRRQRQGRVARADHVIERYFRRRISPICRCHL